MRTSLALLPLLALTLAACGDRSAENEKATATAAAPTTTAAAAATSADAAAPPETDAAATPTTTPTATVAPTATGTPAAEPKAVARLTQQQASRIAHERHERFEEMGDAFKAVTDEIRKDAPDTAKIRAGAATINRLAPQVRTWFPAGSGPQPGIKTDALQTVWAKPAKFRQAVDRLVDQAGKFHATAQGGNDAAIRSASRALGAACKNCHDQFREEDD